MSSSEWAWSPTGPRGDRGAAGLDGLLRIVAALAKVLRLDVADMEEAVATDAEIDEGRLDAGLQVDHHSLVDIAHVTVLAGPFYVQLFQDAVFNDRNPAFLRLGNVDQNFFFHVLAFLFGKTGKHALAAAEGWQTGPLWIAHVSISTAVRVR